MSRRAVPLAALLSLSPVLAMGQALVGPEFQVNTYTTHDQTFPSVAADAAGNFVVVWHSRDQDGDGLGVFARFHDASGAPLGAAEFRVNSWTTGDQQAPRVAATASGQFVVVWESWEQDGPGGAVFARRYDAAGTPLGPEFQVNASTASPQSLPAVALDAAGNFVVAWEGVGADGNSYGVVARQYDAAGQPRGDPFPVNSFTTAAQFQASVASDASGNFVVAWRSFLQDPGSSSGIYAQRYDTLGAPVGGEFAVNVHTTGTQSSPAVASDADGNFAVTWGSAGQDGSGYAVVARRYDSAGAALGGEIAVNTYTTADQVLSEIAFDARGGFAVVWASQGQDGNGRGVYGRHYDALGVPGGPEFRVNTFVTGDQNRPAVAADGSGRFVTVWSGTAQDGSAAGVFGQRFVPDLIFRDGFEDGTLGAWSTSATDGGDLHVSVFAGLKFTTGGLRGIVDDTVGIYVEDRSPVDEERYRARFYFDPNGFDPGEAQDRFRTRIFIAFSEAPARRLVAIVLRRQGGVYSLRARVRLDDDTQAQTPFIPITDDQHVVEFDLGRATAPGAVDGHFAWAIDGVWGDAMSVDNSRSAVDFVRLGALSVKPGANGTLYWDEFESRRQGEIGP
jgi:hypothetical protein